MSSTEVARYLMNPAEDAIIFGDELAEGMWVIQEDWVMRGGTTEDERLRGNRFMRVTRLRFDHAPQGDIACFVGEWIDGYQEARRVHVSFAWVVKKDSIPGAQAPGEDA